MVIKLSLVFVVIGLLAWCIIYWLGHVGSKRQTWAGVLAAAIAAGAAILFAILKIT